MSNKAIVFYTGELQEVRENSLRETHDIDNIIFVPIEKLEDLETKILETTERPFTIYNYLTTPELVLALCDKLLEFTKQTNYKPDYFIWLDDMETNHSELSTTHTSQPETLHKDVNGLEMPNSVKMAMHRITSKLKEARPDAYLSYGEAIEMCKKGIDITCVNWRAGEFLTVNTGLVVHADNFWSPGNKRTAMSNPDQTLAVLPHFLRTTKYGTVPHMVDFNDQFSEWVVASDRIKVKTVSVEGNKFKLHYALDTFSTAEFELAPFWMVYDVLADLPSTVTVITDNDANVLIHIIASMKEVHDNQHKIVEESFEIHDGRIPEEFPNSGVSHYPMAGLNSTIEAIRQGTFKHVIVDSDSFRTDFRLEAIKKALQEAKVNWASISVKEQLFGINE